MHQPHTALTLTPRGNKNTQKQLKHACFWSKSPQRHRENIKTPLISLFHQNISSALSSLVVVLVWSQFNLETSYLFSVHYIIVFNNNVVAGLSLRSLL